MKFHIDSIQWGGPNDDWYFFSWWNWLPDYLRYVGYCQDWYDGPISSFGFWFINWSWSTPWTGHNGNIDISYKTRKKYNDKYED